MAEKNKSSLSYLQKPIIGVTRKSKIVKKTWTGFNRRQVVDSGMLSHEKNISTEKHPFLIPSREIHPMMNLDGDMLGIFGFGDFLIAVHAVSGKVTFSKIKKGGSGYSIIGEAVSASEDAVSQRCIIQFNVFDSPTNVLEGTYTKKLLIFPDKLSVDFDAEGKTFILSPLESDVVKLPDLKYAVVHLSRVFGVDDCRVYASGFNDYTNWNLDTVGEYNESNAWCSASQSNSKAGGDFTGITAFQNHVICFKKDFMHEIYNTKNPFRIQDIYAEGAIDNRTICDVDGQLIFCSEDGIKVYTGGNPKIISYNLGIDRFYDAVAGTDGRCYYLYCRDEEVYGGKHHIFVYDTFYGLWSERDAEDAVIGFAKCEDGFFCLYENGSLCKMDTSYHASEWEFETDLITAESCDIKRIDKLSLAFDVEEVGAGIKIYLIDSVDNELLVWESDESLGYVIARVKIRRFICDAFKIKVVGKGEICIRSMELLIKSGGELYVQRKKH